MKGLILAGGKGTRLRPLTLTRAKQLIPIANKPIIYYVVEHLVRAGIRDVGVVVSPETGPAIREALAVGPKLWTSGFTFIVQGEPKGLAHAVKTARPFLRDSPFLMYLGDNMLSGDLTSAIDAFRSGQSASHILLARVQNPCQFGVAIWDGMSRVTRLVEKPAVAPSDLALVGVYMFTNSIHRAIDGLQPSARDEYEITDAIQMQIEWGLDVTASVVEGWWKDTGKPGDLLDANRLVLSNLCRSIPRCLDEDGIVGNVVVEPGAVVTRSRIHGPAHIAAGATVEDAYIGPYTAIGSGARVVQSEVENSIVLGGARLQRGLRRFCDSIIGEGAVVEGGDEDTGLLRMVLGDHSQIVL